MRILNFSVPSSYEGVKLKGFLRGYCSLSSRLMTALKQIPNGIQVNGMWAKVTQSLHAGDQVCLHLPEDHKIPTPVQVPIQIIYEDADLLIVNKQAGLPMYARPGHDSSLCGAVGFYCLSTEQFFAFRPIYRIDKDTTGLVVLAKNAYVAACLAGGIQKTYYAICEGVMKGAGTIDAAIRVKPGHTVQREVCDGADGETAVTHWKAIASDGNRFTLLACSLETGRTHQIRVHLSSLGYPLAGDDFYGGHRDFIGRQALHCGKLSFIHPVTGSEMEFIAPVPADFKGILWEMGVKNTQTLFYDSGKFMQDI